ncbi:MAG: shikimate dehydrogenase [Acetobacteraceae bacterium]
MSDQHQFALAGIIGWPVAQSRSPVIQNFWLNAHKIPGRYLLLPVMPDQLARLLEGLPLLGFRGCNVTMPHKQNVVPLLDQIDPAARRIGAINTIVVQPDGTLRGFNNDGVGFVQSIRDASPGWRPDSGPVLILGAGGAARAVIVALLDAGARKIAIANRTAERAERMAGEIDARLTIVPWEHRDAAIADAALVVNATDRGMLGRPALEVSLARLQPGAIVGDLIYTPPATPFLQAARERGNLTVNGLGLLLNQARLAFEAWFGVRPEITPELLQAVAATF